MKRISLVPIIGGTLSIALVLVVGSWLFFPRQKTDSLHNPRVTPPAEERIAPSPTASPLPSPTTPVRPLPQGKVPFSVSSAQKTGPQFRNGFIDPYDPKAGDTQTVSIQITDSSAITTVTANLKTDTKSETNTLKLLQGTTTDGRWEGNWTVTDTHNQTYRLILTAHDSEGISNLIEITLR